MRYIRQDDKLIIKDQAGAPVVGIVMMALSIEMLVLIFCTIPLKGETLFVYLLVFPVWVAMLVFGLYVFLSGYRHEWVISPEGVCENCPLLKSKQRLLTWSELEDWGYTFTAPELKSFMAHKTAHYRLYFSDHPISVAGSNHAKRLTKHCISMMCGSFHCVDKELFCLVLPFCAQFTDVKPYRAPEVKY